jgi:capsular polysaccharide biosynthesis protein
MLANGRPTAIGTKGNRDIIAMNTEPGLLTPASDGEYILSLGDMLRMLWRQWWLISLCVLLFTGVALGYSFTQTPKYEASIKILVGQSQVGAGPDSNLSASDLQGLQILTKTVAEGINTRPVAEGVVEELHLPMKPEDVMGRLRVEQVPETQFVEVTYEDPSPVRAQQIVNAYGDVIAKRISDISTDASAITVTVWERATVPSDPVSPEPARNGLMGLALGAILGVTLAFLLENLRGSWRSAEEVERVSGLPTVGVIPRFVVPSGKKTQDTYEID